MMSSHRVPAAGRVALAATACLSVLMLAAPTASPAPQADSRGYVDSTARCAAPATVVVFGSTAASRVAICRDSDGDYQYRGVRVRDGARLILPAQRSADGTFTAENDGVEYTVSASALVISAGDGLIRREPMVDFHSAGTPTATATPTTSPTATPTTAPTATTTTATTAPATPATTTPLPPPLPAEVGGDTGDGG